MSSIMRARSGLAGRCTGWEVIRGSSLELKVAGPSMLGTGCPDRHGFLFKRSSLLPTTHDRDACPPARAGSFLGAYQPIPFPTANFRSATRKRSLSKLSVGGAAFNFNR